MPDSTNQNTTAKPTPRRHPAIRLAMLCAGLGLITLGTALGFVPFIPGFPLGIAGLVLISASSQRLRRYLRSLAQRLPHHRRQQMQPLLQCIIPDSE